MFSRQLRLGTFVASLIGASGAFAAGSVASPHPGSPLGTSSDASSLVVAQVERIGPKQDDPRALKPNPNRGSLAIGPKQDDPRQGIIVQGGRSDGLAIGPKQDDPRALKPNPNSRSRGLTPNPN
jgi:hypothetical protein